MKTQLILASSILVVLGAAACGSSVCSKASSANDHRAACNTLPDGGFRSYNTSACESGIGACSDADRKTLDNAFKCVTSLSVCTPATQATFDQQSAECAANAASQFGAVSAGCTSAIAAGFTQ